MVKVHRGRPVLICTGFVVALIVLGTGQAILDDAAVARGQGSEAPVFEVDPFWPKPLPNHWVIGSAIGVTVDSRDHVFIIHRQQSLNPNTEISAGTNPPTAPYCCVPAPPVLEFDPDGNLINHWGGPGDGYEWPESNHGITIDPKDNIWIGGNGQSDSHLLKFSRDGKFLAQYGEQGARRDPSSPASERRWVGDSHDMNNFGRVAEVSFDSSGAEVFVADGYLNKRVAVLDANTGELRRYWGAYGNEPDDEDLGPYDPDAPLAQQFRNPVHCAQPSEDGLVYVCDRVNNRVQVFEADGQFVDEIFLAKESLGSGAVWDLAFSTDPEQRYLYVADGKNEKVYVIERASLTLLTSFGDGGRQPGQFFGVHSIATDSKGNIYTTETYEGKRLQKFVYKGIGEVDADQGTPWPKAAYD